MLGQLALIAGLTFLSATCAWGAKGYGPGEQEYGIITIRNGAHIFYWLYYAQEVEDPLTRPTVVFLSGGPGISSSGVGNFGQVGPLHTNGSERAASWAKHVNVLYVDQPIGTGYDMIFNTTVLQKDNIANGGDITQFMLSFFNFHPPIHHTPIYFYAEGFGGKNMVELSYQLDVAIAQQRISMDFRGIVLAGPWISPGHIIGSWPQFLLDKGLVNQAGFATVTTATNRVLKAIADKAWQEGTWLWLDLLDAIDTATGSVDLLNINRKNSRRRRVNAKTGRVDPFSYVTIPEDEQIQNLMNNEVREALITQIYPEMIYDQYRDDVFDGFGADFLFPVINVISDLLRDSPLEISFVTGGLDLLVATPGFEAWVSNMTWPGSDQWFQTPKSPFVVNGNNVGTMRHYGNLTMYWIDQAGHMVPRDQPDVGMELLRLFSHYDEN